MRLGVWLPVVCAYSVYGSADWEFHAGAAELAAVARAADDLGYHCICAPEHVAVPVGRPQGTRYWDPLSVLGFLAAHTSKVRLVPLVVVLGYHHPLDVVKRYGTLDLISGGRVVLGVGVGGTEGEFALLGASFTDRGARADDSIAAIQAAMGTTRPTYQGTYYSYSEMVVDPPLRAGVQMWVGGASRAALRRALRFAQGWAPTGLELAELRSVLTELDPDHLRPDGFEVAYLQPGEHALDPLGDPAKTRSYLAGLPAAGVTMLLPRLISQSATHYVDQMAALAGMAREVGA